MNIFFLHPEPKICAQMACDKHVVKMTLETAQILSNVHPESLAPYRQTHINHPCCIWARETDKQYAWLLRYGINLGLEFHYRFNKHHASFKIIKQIARLGTSHIKFPGFNFKNPPQVVPPDCQVKQAPGGTQNPTVYAYRAHYIRNCADFATWNKGRSAPDWWPQRIEDTLTVNRKPHRKKNPNELETMRY